MTTPGQNPSPDIITGWPVFIGQDYDTAAVMCDAWVPHYRDGTRIIRCHADIFGWTMGEITEILTMHIKNVRHVPPPEPYAQNWNGHGVWDPEEENSG